MTWMALTGAACLGQTAFQGLTPGGSTRAEVSRSLGQPVLDVSDTLSEYAPLQGMQKVSVEYRGGSETVERIDLLLVKPVKREGVLRRFSLPEASDARTTNGEGRLMEYFAGSALIVLTYKTAEEADGVIGIGHYSRDLFKSTAPAEAASRVAAPPPPTVAAQPPVAARPAQPSAPARPAVSPELIESNYQSNLLDAVISDGGNFLASQPAHARVNLRVGQSYFKKSLYREATPYFARAVAGGETPGFTVRRHRKSLGVFDDLQDGTLYVNAAGLQLQLGDDTYQLPFAQLERLEMQTDQLRGPCIYVKGAVVNKKGKTEKKDYKFYSPSAGLVMMTALAGNPTPVVSCQGCETWTAEIISLINRSKTAVAARTN